MGQRLAIVVYQPNSNKEGMAKFLATAYYHWDAYTLQALENLKTCYECWEKYQKSDSHESLLHKAVHILEATGAGVTVEAENALGSYACRFTKAHSHIAGLIDITEDEMQTSLHWAEGEAYFNIETGEITFEVFNYLFKEDIEEQEITKQEIEQALPISFSKDCSEDITNFSGKNIQKVIDYLEKNETCLFKDPNNNLDASYLSCIY